MVGSDDEDDILARAIGDVGVAVTGRRSVRYGWRWAARRLKTIAHEEELILDVPPSAAVEPIHAVLAATKHPLLSGQPAIANDPHGIRWITGGGSGKLNPVLITVGLTSETYGTSLKIRGAAKEGVVKQRSVAESVDRIMGMITDHFDKWDIIDVIG